MKKMLTICAIDIPEKKKHFYPLSLIMIGPKWPQDGQNRLIYQFIEPKVFFLRRKTLLPPIIMIRFDYIWQRKKIKMRIFDLNSDLHQPIAPQLQQKNFHSNLPPIMISLILFIEPKVFFFLRRNQLRQLLNKQ